MIKTVSRSVLAVAALIIAMMVPGAARAQQGNFSPEQMRARYDEQNKQLIEQLALTEEQTPKFLEVMNVQYEARMKMFEEARASGAGFQGMREQMTALNEETTKKLAEVLTEEQLEKYNQIQAERRRNFGGGPPN